MAIVNDRQKFAEAQADSKKYTDLLVELTDLISGKSTTARTIYAILSDIEVVRLRLGLRYRPFAQLQEWMAINPDDNSIYEQQRRALVEAGHLPATTADRERVERVRRAEERGRKEDEENKRKHAENQRYREQHPGEVWVPTHPAFGG